MMHARQNTDTQRLSRLIGYAFLTSILIGIATAFTVAQGIDINLSADIASVSANMLDADLSLRAKAYITALIFALDVFVYVGLFVLLRDHGLVLTGWSAMLGLGASILVLLSAMFAMNVALIANNAAFETLANDSERLLLTSIQVISDYTSFHLSLVLSSLAMAGFYIAFFRSKLIPYLLSGWGVFASLFVASVIVARDFIPALGADAITAAFMLSNLIVLVATGLYLAVWGVKTD